MIIDDFEFPVDALATNRAGRPSQYPFADLLIGQGMSIEADAKKQRSIASTLSRARKAHAERQFTTACTATAFHVRRDPDRVAP